MSLDKCSIRDAVCRAEGIPWLNRSTRQQTRVMKIVEEVLRETSRPMCETCHDNPYVCAEVPGLRHCEKAIRESDPAQ